MNKDIASKVATTSVTYTTAALLFVSLNVAATGTPQDVSRIGVNSLNNTNGIIGVNMAAGDNNIQANNKSIAIGQHAQAITKADFVVTDLSNQNLTEKNHSIASVRIEANTLQNSHGLIAINQVSGSNNAQLNDMTLLIFEGTLKRVLRNKVSYDDARNNTMDYIKTIVKSFLIKDYEFYY